MGMIFAFFTRKLGGLWPYIVTAAITIGGVLAVYTKGMASGKAKRDAADAKANLDARKRMDATRPPADAAAARDRLRKHAK